MTSGLIFLTWYGVSQATAIYITFTYCTVAKPLRWEQLTFNHQTPNSSLTDQLINLGRRKDSVNQQAVYLGGFIKKALVKSPNIFVFLDINQNFY